MMYTPDTFEEPRVTEHRNINHLVAEVSRLERELTLKNEIISEQADTIVRLQKGIKKPPLGST